MLTDLMMGSGFGSQKWIDMMFDEFNALAKSPNFAYEASFPPMNCFIDSDCTGFTLQIALAGYKKEQLNVVVDGQTLVIKANVPEENEDGGKKYLVKKRIKIASFEKYYKVPQHYDLSKTEVSYADGLLTVFVPCRESETLRTIDIK